MRSSSTFGLSLITLSFSDGADDYWERQRVTERIARSRCRRVRTPSLGALTGPAGEIYRYTLESSSKNLMELSEIQRWMVIPALKQVPGVADVDNFGGFTKEFQLELDPRSCEHYGVSVNDVINATSTTTARTRAAAASRAAISPTSCAASAWCTP